MNISSIGAQICPPGSGYHAATKAALEAVSSSLRKEVEPLGIGVIAVEPLGIGVIAVEPGGFRTDFAGRSLHQAAEPIADYAETAGRRRIEHDNVHGTQPGDPERAAQVLITAVASSNPPELLLLGSDALGAYRAVLDARRAESDAWEAASRSTDLPD